MRLRVIADTAGWLAAASLVFPLWRGLSAHRPLRFFAACRRHGGGRGRGSSRPAGGCPKRVSARRAFIAPSSAVRVPAGRERQRSCRSPTGRPCRAGSSAGQKTAPVLLLALMAIPGGARCSAARSRSPSQAFVWPCTACSPCPRPLCGSLSTRARWLAPTTVVKSRFAVALLWRVVLRQVLVLAVLIFLTGVVDPPRTLAVGIPLAALYLCASLALAVIVVLDCVPPRRVSAPPAGELSIAVDERSPGSPGPQPARRL